jgi:hypothetical protein
MGQVCCGCDCASVHRSRQQRSRRQRPAPPCLLALARVAGQGNNDIVVREFHDALSR